MRHSNDAPDDNNNFTISKLHFAKAAQRGVSPCLLALSTNAPASIAPVGGKKAVVGTNPISIAVPLEGDAAIIIDQSASVVAKSEISVRAKTGESIPEGWAFDAEGNVTTNAQEALKGTMAPSGG